MSAPIPSLVATALARVVGGLDSHSKQCFSAATTDPVIGGSVGTGIAGLTLFGANILDAKATAKRGAFGMRTVPTLLKGGALGILAGAVWGRNEIASACF
jgi:hypothetical protein